MQTKMSDGWLSFSCYSFRVLVLCMVAHCHDLQRHKTEPFYITSVNTLVKESAVYKVCLWLSACQSVHYYINLPFRRKLYLFSTTQISYSIFSLANFF